MIVYSQYPQVDIILNDYKGKPISFVEVKLYPTPSEYVKRETFNILEDYADKLKDKSVRYTVILSPATGYVRNLDTHQTMEFSTNSIISEYLPGGVSSNLNSQILTSAFSTWLRDLSLGVRQLSQSEKKLEKIGFIDEIRGTAPQIAI